MALIGTGVALVTPFNGEGFVDFESLRKLINHTIAGGVEYLVLMGTTAESATLTKEEKDQVVNFIIEENNGRLPLVLGIGGNNTRAVIERIKSTDLSKFEAILSVSPYYNKPSQEGIYQHFAAIAEVCPVDIIMYNVPSRTASNMSNETVIRLAEDFENIVAIKDATGDIFQGMRLIANKPKDFLVISGDDALTVPLTLLGGSGVISVIGQALPIDFSEMVRLALQGKVQEANDLHYKLLDFIEYIFEEGNPVGIKSMLKTLDICDDGVRLPLISASNLLSDKISSRIKRLYTRV
jgi:4-hydroxy-tetrahydrodipicolinate synthase